MAMPLNLVLVRHGESEGNIAVARSKKNDHSAYDGPFADRHSSQWRLSPRGVTQAEQAGEWINTNLGLKFDRFYTSSYIRAIETAAHLGIENANWFEEFYLRERNWGDFDSISVKDRTERFKEALKFQKTDPLYWTPPNGTSIADVCLRVDRLVDTLHRECDGKNVIIVCHGEVMWAFRLRLERMSPETFFELDTSPSPFHRIHNCQIIHYTRIDPTQQRSPSKYLGWMKSVCPWDPEKSNPHWTTIHRPSYSNLALLARVEKVKPIIVG